MLFDSVVEGSPEKYRLGLHCSSGDDILKICPSSAQENVLKTFDHELECLDQRSMSSYTQWCMSEREHSVNDTTENTTFVPPVNSNISQADADTKYCVYVVPEENTSTSSVSVKVLDPLEAHPLSQCNPISPEIAHDARLEASVLKQVAELRKKGLWSANRLPKVMEEKYENTWHTSFIDEIIWMAVDFTQERKWKKKMALILAESAQKYLIIRQEWNKRCEFAETLLRKRTNGLLAAGVRNWWLQLKEDVSELGIMAKKRNMDQLLNLNAQSAMANNDTSLTWMAEVPCKSASPLPYRSDRQRAYFMRSDGDSDDSDWLPPTQSERPECSISPASRSTSSSRAGSFIDGSVSDSSSSDWQLSVPSRDLSRSVNQHSIVELDNSSDEGMFYEDTQYPVSEPTGGSNQSDVDPIVKSESYSTSEYTGPDCVDAYELEGLTSDLQTPLTDLLKSYEKNMKRTPWKQEDEEDTKVMPCSDLGLTHHSQSINPEVVVLKADSNQPLQSLLPSGYLESSSPNAAVADAELETHVKLLDCTDTHAPMIGSSPLSNTDDLIIQTDGDVNEQDSKSGMTSAPCDEKTMGTTRSHHGPLNERRRAALGLVPVLRGSRIDPEALVTVCTPTFRVDSLPSVRIGKIVAWLRLAFTRNVPGLLLTCNHISGNAELAVAAHLGQLIIPGPTDGTLSSDEPSKWGPHLIVTPRLCIPAWRMRLSNWCPGIRVTCLAGLGERYEPSGTGRRLRASITHGTVHVCLTSYTAVLARPSRYSRIRWSVVVFDQVHHLLPCSDVRQWSGKQEHNTASDSQKPESVHSSKLIDTLLSTIHDTGHRLLISSVPELLSSACDHRLLALSRLLLSSRQEMERLGQGRLWTTELLDSIVNSHRTQALRRRPTKKQLISFLEPFCIRLEEEYDSDNCTEEELVHCPMTPIQRKLHDATLSNKTARNALKTGDLLDLLRTASVAARICNHPALAETNPRSSTAFLDTLSELSSLAEPQHSPFMLRIPDADTACYRSHSLIYTTPFEAVRAVNQLRRTELSEITLQGFNLYDALQAPTHIRERVATLTPARQHLETILDPTCVKLPITRKPDAQHTLHEHPCGGGGDVLKPVINATLPQSPRYDPRPCKDNKWNFPLTNGLPERMAMMLDFSGIPVRSKRPRTTDGGPHSPSQPGMKRPRVMDEKVALSEEATLSKECEQKLSPLPFLGPDILRLLDDEKFFKGKSQSDSRKLPARGSDAVVARQFNMARLSDSGAPVTQFTEVDKRSAAFTPSIRLNSLFADNARRCKQLTGFADWCSSVTVNKLRLENTGACSMFPTSTELNRFPFQRTHLPQSFALSPTSKITPLISKLLCVRPRAIATPASHWSSSKSPLLHWSSRSSGNHHWSGLSNVTVQSASQLALVYSCAERTRWLSVNSITTMPFNRFLASGNTLNQSNITPIGRLFSESGKFRTMHGLLYQLLGATTTRRPRCVFFLAHRSAFLDLLEAFLLCSAWRDLSRIRVPGKNTSMDNRQSALLVERINLWPHGSHGPLLVLIHSRTPPASLCGLSAGPDTVVVVCDVDWRSDSADNLRALLHSWAINGLAKSQRTSENLPDTLRPTLRVYRLVTTESTDSPARPGLCPSLEACLAHGVACRLLPDSVFQANCTSPQSTSERNALLVAKVQPNVVNELLLPITEFPTVSFTSGMERDSLLVSVKQEAMSCSSTTSSITSSVTYPIGEGRREESQLERIGDAFQEREPLGEHLLHRAFELFEDPVDAQFWCSATAETKSIGFSDPQEEELPTGMKFETDLLNEPSPLSHGLRPADVFMYDWPVASSLSIAKPGQSEFEKDLGYSEWMSWELAQHESLDQLARFDLVAGDALTFDATAISDGVIPSEMDSDWLLPTMPVSLSELPIWEPFLGTNQSKPDQCMLSGSNTLRSSDLPGIKVTAVAKLESHVTFTNPLGITSLSSHPSAVDSDWGYESEPMSDDELPPVTHTPRALNHAALTPYPRPLGVGFGSATPGVLGSSNHAATINSTAAGGGASATANILSTASKRPGSPIQPGKMDRYNAGLHSTTQSPISVNSRSAFGGPYLKRRKLAGGTTLASPSVSASRKPMMPIGQTPLTDVAPASPMGLAGESDDLTASPLGTGRSASRDSCQSHMTPQSASPASSSVGTGHLNATGVGAAAGPALTSSNTVLLSLTHAGSGAIGGAKLHIPRASYNKELNSSRVSRLRRLNSSSGGGAAIGSTPASAMGTGAHLTQPKVPSYGAVASQLSSPGMNPFSNPAILARYGHHTSPGRQSQSAQANQSSSRYGLGAVGSVGTAGVGGNFCSQLSYGPNGASASGHLHVGTPLEWLPYEEAALHQSVVKLQDAVFDQPGTGSAASTTASVCSPNFRLAEFFVNNFFPTRCYRGARQCLLMHAKMSSVAHTATAALSAGTGTLQLPSGSMPTSDDPSAIITPIISIPVSTHGPTGRKVKNKLKSSAAINTSAHAAGGSGSIGGLGPGGANTDPSADTALAVQKYKSYLSYQYLQSDSASESQAGIGATDSSTNNPVPTALPSQLSQLFQLVRLHDEHQSRFVRRAIKDLFLTPIPSASSSSVSSSVIHSNVQHHRSASTTSRAESRRGLTSSGFSLPNQGSSGSLYHAGQSGGSSGSLYNTYGSAVHPSTTTSGSYLPSSTAPALLTHHRHHHHHLQQQHQHHLHHRLAAHDSATGASGNAGSVTPTSTSGGGGGSDASTGASPIATGGSVSGGTFSGPMIQKNPTHIAALQEHNINPDTLITPAMVIKNKEEREARLLAEAMASGIQTSISGASNVPLACTSPVTSSTALSHLHSAGSAIGSSQSADSTIHPILLSVPSSDASPAATVGGVSMGSSGVGSHMAISTSAIGGLTSSSAHSLNHPNPSGHLSLSHANQRGASYVTIVSSNPSLQRRPGSYTSMNQQQQLNDSPTINTWMGSFPQGQQQHHHTSTSGIGSVASQYNNNSNRLGAPTSYFLQQQRPPQQHFLTAAAANQAINPSVTRGPGGGIFTNLQTTHSGMTSAAYGATAPVAAAPLSQILRPRGALIRGPMLQSTFVRTVATTNATALSQLNARSVSSGGMTSASGVGSYLHSRFALSVQPSLSGSSGNPNNPMLVSHGGLSTSRGNTFSSVVRGQAASFHSVRPTSLGQIPNVASQQSMGYATTGESRSFFNQLQHQQQQHLHHLSPQVIIATTSGTSISGAPLGISSNAIFESASSRQSESDPFVQSRFRLQPPNP